MAAIIAKIAVSAATYWIDKPYDYLIPENLADKVKLGVRVYVPFSRGNRKCEGIVLALAENTEYEQLKPVLQVLDEEPVLTEEQIRLALFMRERFFCTVYEAVKAMLPIGLWFNDDGKRRAKDKVAEMARLTIDAEDALQIAANKRQRSPQQANLLELLSTYGAISTHELLNYTGAPKQSLKALEKQELIELFSKEVFRRPEVYVGETDPLPVLNAEQQKVYEGLKDLIVQSSANAALLFGVTGSGKTSVYVNLIADCLTSGKTAILLVPEIALTPQMLQTFSSYFGNDIAVLHSSLSTGERYDEWKRIKYGKARLVIGTRSAIFAPVQNLGIIIIDEEQEETYKSENNPRYNARDVAKYICAKSGALLLLGSATPDVDSMYNAKTGRYKLFELKNRFNEMSLPEVTIVDMKRELRRGNTGDISLFLRDEIQKNIDNGEQSILFINRRGTNKLVTCGDCGYTFKCKRCSVSLTYHSTIKRLVCHYCGFSQPLRDDCPDCGGTLKYLGTGTQHVEEELHELFPNVEVLRMDTDSVAPAGSHEVLFDRFKNEKIPIMVGTKMVAKGLNFENVTLVGVLSADQSLYAPDYRAGERTFSLITQVIGRSGRGEKSGRAVIQTFTPENETILQSARQDYMDFYSTETILRRIQNCPPYADLFAVTVSGQIEDRVVRCAKYIRGWLEIALKNRQNAVVLGPVPLSVVKVNNRFRYRINISCKADSELRAYISQVVTECSQDKRFRGLSIYADNDPAD